jgi:hypothetical protein
MSKRTMRAFGTSMKAKTGRLLARRCGGWGSAEYIVVLAGLMVTWRGAQVVLALIREHHREFSWALMLPF